MNADNDIYYVYMYLRDKASMNGPAGSPYYIGKGKGDRYKHWGGTDTIKPSKDKSNIRFLKEYLSEDDAYLWEAFWIAEFGRLDLGTGCLRNKTDGGVGGTGHKSPIKGKTKETCDIVKQMSESHKGTIPWNKNIPRTESEIASMIDGHKNREYFGCEFCKKSVTKANYIRWHGLKCKSSPAPKERNYGKIYTCECCGESCNAGLYKINHGLNCKGHKKNSVKYLPDRVLNV